MIYLHKYLPIFLMPIALFCVLLVYGLFKGFNKLIVYSIIIFYCFSTPVVSSFIFKLVEGPYESSLTQKVSKADAIVVLSGMISLIEFDDTYDIQWGDPDRFFCGIRLMKENKADVLIFTGGKPVFQHQNLSEGEILKEYAIEMGIEDRSILISADVQNTYEESVAVKNIMGEKRDILLVTSAFHMNRAKSLFEAQGFNVQSIKVDYKVFPGSELQLIHFLPTARSLVLTEIALREVIGRVYYSFF